MPIKKGFNSGNLFGQNKYSAANETEDNSYTFLDIKDEYLGKKKPGMTPEIFAPGFISTTAKEFAGTFSPDGKEYYFTRSGGNMKLRTNTIMETKLVNNRWTEPKIAPFSGTYFDFEPHISPDGKRLYFGSRRPLSGHAKPGILHQWFMEKTDAGWSKPQPLGSPFSELPVMYPTVAKNGNIYFSEDTEVAGIFVSKLMNGIYQKPEKLSDKVNFLPAALHPFIAADESYLIFDAQPHGQETGPDLFISFRNQDGSWTKAKNMGYEINKSREMCASVSPDGKYLFFTRDGDIYWVDARIIEKMKVD